MTTSWDKLPLEMRQSIVSEMHPISRAKLSMCSKADNELVRSTKNGRIYQIMLTRNNFDFSYTTGNFKERGFSVISKKGGGSAVYNFKGLPRPIEIYTTDKDVKETILNIMRVIGTKVSVNFLSLYPEDDSFDDYFRWFRKHIIVKPKMVRIDLTDARGFNDKLIEPLIDWPSYVKIELMLSHHRLPIFEKFDACANIARFRHLDRRNNVVMTDDQLKKLVNAKYIHLHKSHVTLDGFKWWLKRWINRKEYVSFPILYDFHEFRATFRHNLSLDDVVKGLSNVIESTQRCFKMFQECWRIYIRKSETEYGVIEIFQDELSFKSSVRMARAYPKQKQ